MQENSRLTFRLIRPILIGPFFSMLDLSFMHFFQQVKVSPIIFLLFDQTFAEFSLILKSFNGTNYSSEQVQKIQSNFALVVVYGVWIFFFFFICSGESDHKKTRSLRLLISIPKPKFYKSKSFTNFFVYLFFNFVFRIYFENHRSIFNGTNNSSENSQKMKSNFALMVVYGVRNFFFLSAPASPTIRKPDRYHDCLILIHFP